MILWFFPKKASFSVSPSQKPAGEADFSKNCLTRAPCPEIPKKSQHPARPSTPPSRKPGDFGENKVRRGIGTVTVPRYGAGPPSPLTHLPGIGRFRQKTRPGEEWPTWQYAGTARQSPSLSLETGDFGENKVRQRTGAVAVRRYGAAPVLRHDRSSQPKAQALP